MQEESSRRATLEALNRVIREASALGQMFSEAVAAKVGLGGADLEYLDVLTMRGRMTAGDLAKATGLTSGAVTGVVDRLEAAGFVRRERDRDDRRRVFITVRHERLGKLQTFYRPLARAINALADGYSDAEIAAFLDYFTRSRDIMRSQLKRVKG
jgi:DNA-binding MarR family transcriptional regulator